MSAGGLPDAGVTAEIEACAVEAVRSAARVLTGRFGTRLEVEFKDEAETDPATDVDNRSQAIIREAVSDRFPGHLVVGEEDEDGDESPVPDFVWAVDPLDGTKNFLNGLPIYACSVGVLFRGIPVAAAVHIPWPGESEGVVLRARENGGAYRGEEPVTVSDAAEPGPVRLTTLPGMFRGAFRVKEPLRGKLGEVRNTGSIAYDLAMTAQGVLQYTVAGNPRIWDIAGGALLVREAGGAAMAARGFGKGAGRLRWSPLAPVVPGWETGKTTVADLRRWSEPVVFGPPRLVSFVTGNLTRRRRFGSRISRAFRRRRS